MVLRKSEGGDSWESEQHVVRRRKQRDGTETGKLNQGDACALELSAGYPTDVHHVRGDETAG